MKKPPANRPRQWSFLIPQTVDEILSRADECVCEAENATNKVLKTRYLNMARYWLILAKEVIGSKRGSGKALFVK
jgi:hypothetical protein